MGFQVGDVKTVSASPTEPAGGDARAAARKPKEVPERSSSENPGGLAERLLDAAEAEILEHGTSGVSLRAIARRAGVSHQAPGYAFTDRAGLLSALTARGQRVLNEALRAAGDADGARASTQVRLTEICVAYVLFAARRPALFRLVVHFDLPIVSDELDQVRRETVAILRDAVRDAMAEGWHSDEPVEHLAALCWGLVHGLTVLHRDGRLSYLLDGPLEAIVRTALRQLIPDD